MSWRESFKKRKTMTKAKFQSEVMDEQALSVLDKQLSALGESGRILMRLKLTGTVDLAV